MAYVYILRCADDSYYVGSARNLDYRLEQHAVGEGSAYTRRPGRRPVTLVWSHRFTNIGDAFAFEKQVQGWSRAKREALIRGDYAALPALAKKNFAARTGPQDPPPTPG